MSKKEFTTSERIALTVALEAMRNLGWSDQPEMLLDKLLLANVEREIRQYEVLFTLFGERQNIYKVAVTIRAESDSDSARWVSGVVLAFHWIAKTPWITTFKVNWVRDFPQVRVEPFH